jgi:hypothetical protein
MNPSLKAKPDLSPEPRRGPGSGKIKRFLVLILSLVILGVAVVLCLLAWDFNGDIPAPMMQWPGQT